MKKIVHLVLCALFLASISVVSANAGGDSKKTRKEQNAEVRKELDAKASKYARKEAKAKIKEGWKPIGAGRPIEAQLDRVWKYQLENENGEIEYIVQIGTANGKTLSAAQAAAKRNAQILIARELETSIGVLIEGELNNSALSDEEVQSLDNMRQVDQSFIQQNLKKTITLAEWYRKTDNGVYQVELTMALKISTLKEDVREAWLNETQSRNEDMHQKLSGKLDEPVSE